MQVIQHIHHFPLPPARGGVLCIGNFDGVHVGHASMLRTARTLADQHNLPFTIMTFEPHPGALLRPDVPRKPLSVIEQRQDLLAQFNPDVLLILPTTHGFLSISADDFLSGIVRKTLGATHIVEGPTFTFGRGAKGNVDMLRTRGPEFGLTAHIVPTAQVTLTDMTIVNVSSTLIRWLVDHGRMLDAAACLGRPYTLHGTVAHGAKRGRTLGFPTINLATLQLLPAAGVYAGIARLPDASTRAAAISVGTNPTFSGPALTVEAFLLDYDGDVYDKVVQLEFHRWLREQYTYSGIEPLVAQLHRDVADTRRFISLRESA